MKGEHVACLEAGSITPGISGAYPARALQAEIARVKTMEDIYGITERLVAEYGE
jgi:hypothetical protein